MRISQAPNFFPDPISVTPIFQNLSQYWGGNSSAVHLICGQAGSGKTVFCHSLILNIAKKEKCGLVPLEMGHGLGFRHIKIVIELNRDVIENEIKNSNHVMAIH